jgi:hypothetical protein
MSDACRLSADGRPVAVPRRRRDHRHGARVWRRPVVRQRPPAPSRRHQESRSPENQVQEVVLVLAVPQQEEI